jgi:hypothetical protein
MITRLCDTRQWQLTGIILTALGTALLVAGCSTGINVSGAWQPPRPASVPYNNILVVCIFPSGRARKIVEQEMVDGFSADGTQATASFDIERKTGVQPLSRKNIMAMAMETGADAVVVTRMLDYSAESGKSKSEAYVKVGRQVEVIETANTTQVWAGNYSVQQTPGQPIIMNEVYLESTVYDVSDNGRSIYVISTESKFKIDSNTYMENVTRDVANAIVKNVRQAKLIR